MKTTQIIQIIIFLLAFSTMGFSQINKNKSNYDDVIFRDKYLSYSDDKSITVAHISNNQNIVFDNRQIRVSEPTLTSNESKNVDTKTWPSILYIQEESDLITTNGKIVFETLNLTKPIIYHANINRASDAIYTQNTRLFRVEMKN